MRNPSLPVGGGADLGAGVAKIADRPASDGGRSARPVTIGAMEDLASPHAFSHLVQLHERHLGKVLPATPAGRLRERREQAKASIRAIVEHPFHTVKNLLGHRKARYRGLAKNEAQLFTLFGLANLLRLKRELMARPGVSAS